MSQHNQTSPINDNLKGRGDDPQSGAVSIVLPYDDGEEVEYLQPRQTGFEPVDTINESAEERYTKYRDSAEERYRKYHGKRASGTDRDRSRSPPRRRSPPTTPPMPAEDKSKEAKKKNKAEKQPAMPAEWRRWTRAYNEIHYDLDEHGNPINTRPAPSKPYRDRAAERRARDA